MDKFVNIFEIEVEKNIRQNRNQLDECKQMENRIRNIILQERDFTKNSIETNIQKIQSQIENFGKNYKEENQSIKVNINSIEEYCEVYFYRIF